VDPYLGEIRMFGGTFAPAGWLFCDGSLLRIADNDVLYAVIGTTYGGDGVETFALPDLQGRWPVHTAPDLPLGARGGSETVTLTAAQLPAHTHGVLGSAAAATATSPDRGVWAATTEPGYAPGAVTGTPLAMAPDALATTGGSAAHDNLPPYLAVHFIIAVVGVYPSPS
jgi:microcystin-dependent protein